MTICLMLAKRYLLRLAQIRTTYFHSYIVVDNKVMSVALSKEVLIVDLIPTTIDKTMFQLFTP